MDEEQVTTAVQVNPLTFMSMDPTMRRAQGVSGPPEAGALLNDLLTCGQTTQSIADVVLRYEELGPLDRRLQIALHDEGVLTELVGLARSAKMLYLIAQYRACIALCGYIGETIVSFAFEQTKLRIRGKDATDSQFRALFGEPFEKMDQERRIDIIKVLLGWDEAPVSKAHELRTIRNRYLHRRRSAARASEGKDAAKAYRLAVELAEPFANLRLGPEGTVTLSPGQLGYLHQKRGSRKTPPGE